jgi:hypothetical protein
MTSAATDGEAGPQRAYRFRTAERKCSGCGYRVVTHYVIETSRHAAETHFGEYEGFCGDCLLDILVETNAAIDLEAA